MKRLLPWLFVLGAIAVVTLIFALAFVAFAFAGSSPLTATERYPVLRDLLMIVLTASALIIALFGALGFWTVRSEMKRDVENQVRDRYMGAIAAALTSSADSIHDLYLGNQNALYLQTALNLAQHAHDNYTGRLVHSGNADYVRLVCDVRNNIAAYVAEKCQLGTASPEERHLAQEYAKYLEGRLVDYASDETRVWSDTINAVRKNC